MDAASIISILKSIRDPQTGQNIVDRNMVQELEIAGTAVSFAILLPNLHMPGKAELNFACIGAIAEVYPQAQVHIHFKAQSDGAKQASSATPHIKNIIAVASGKGGVGKSTIAVNLALGLRKLGAKVGLMDADVYGPSIPTMLNLVNQRPRIQEIMGVPKMVPLMAYDIPVISIGNIIDAEQAVVLRGPRLAAIIKQFFNDVIWDALDYLVVDLPPGTGDVQLTLVQTVPVTGVVLVTTPQEVAVADAVKAMNMFKMPQIDVPILGVVENMSWFTPAELPNNKYYLFGEGGGKRMAQLSESVLLGQVPLVQSVREGGDNGIPQVLNSESEVAGIFMKIAQNTVNQIALRHEMLGPTQIVQVTQ